MILTEAINKVIRERRAIFPKTYNDIPVDKSVIIQMLENANWAPTHKFTEPWRFKVFSGKPLLKLGTFLANWYKENTDLEFYSEMKYKKTITKAEKSSFVIAICMQRDPEKRIPEFEEIASVACAVQNMWLTASAYGIGAYWSSPKVIFSLEIRDFLKLNEEERCLGFMYIGNHDLPEMKGKRKPVSDKITWM